MKTEFEKMLKLYFESMMKSWENRSGIVKVTQVELDLLAENGWTYDEFVAENQKYLTVEMAAIEGVK